LPTYDTYITDPTTDDEIPVTVKYEYTPASRGSRERGTGLALEPDEPSKIDIFSVTDGSGKSYQLSDQEKARIVDQIVSDEDERYRDSLERDYYHDNV
jgi:hypothetical protein